MNLLYVTNGAAVGIFGMVLSGAFCDIHWTKEKREFLVGSIFVLLAIQGVMYSVGRGSDDPLSLSCDHTCPDVYCPLHFNEKTSVDSVSVLTAYLCCQLRRWVALFIMAVFVNSETVQNVTELIATLPLLFLLLRFVAPSVRAISNYPVSIQLQFGLIPALGYGFDYLTRVYTDLLSEGIPAAVEFMPFVCCIAYLVFVLRTSEEERKKNELEQMQSCLNLQISQAVREIEALRESQKDASTYRHDLRHHMQHLLSCIENGKIEQAEGYIHEVCAQIEAGRVKNYCENETVNLIFSSFAGRAESAGATMNIKAVVPYILPVSETDLCVLLSNALENALHACTAQEQKGTIDILAYEKNGRFFFQVTNPCRKEVVFENGVPVTDRPGHGIGVRSICAIVDRYGGMYSFLVEDNKFILRGFFIGVQLFAAL